MAKQLNVDLRFSADTSQAKAAMQDLQNTLSQIAKAPAKASNLFDDTQIRKASQAAIELKQHLANATNVDTGKLDLSRLSISLKSSGQSLSQFCNTLISVGPAGEQAFLQVARAIATADAPVTKVNAKVAALGTTLKNTAKWQISSSLLHGFMGAVQSAYGYAQDLNESLNNIRIVTGQSADQMAIFAEKANRAAKELSTTTTEYTNASLIYYQQGLSDSEVEARTNVTIKMANAAGESATKVSDQLTAIWNNFYDGSKSLEYYADVMTALGAATASSTDEIAGGLEKFAAIGETIGLSYEYAASALATITSNTRQSEEVVGTALKTIFARIQGLELGDTLEDGLNLNKYSEALSKVGISIFDSRGELKKMDNILNEMAITWDTLNKGQQTALAQTVAGVRQYTQLIALMENWNNGDSDSMVANLNTANNAEGALQEQADIYAESWEAAQDRVRAAAENIYDSLLKDEFFIDLLNGFEKVLTVVGGFIDGLGGLKGVIGVIGSLFLTNFAQKMPAALNDLRQNLMVFTGQSKKLMAEMQNELSVQLSMKQADPGLSESYKLQLQGISKVNEMKQKLVLASKNLSTQEREEYELKIKNVEAMYEEVAALAEKKQAAEKAEKAASKEAIKTATRSSTGVFDQYNAQQDKISSLEDKATTPGTSDESTEKYAKAMETAQQEAIELEMQIERVKKAYGLTADEVDALIGTNSDQELLAETQKKIAEKTESTAQAFQNQIKQRSNLEGISVSVKSQATAWTNVAKAIKQAHAEGGKKTDMSKEIDLTKQKMEQYLAVLQKLAKDNGLELSEQSIREMADQIKSMNVDNIEAVTGDFEKFAQTVSTQAEGAITELDTAIEDLRADMTSMRFDDQELKDLEQSAEGAATAAQDLDNSMSNIDGIAEEDIQGTFKMSVAMTQFASTAMSVSSLITSVKSAISVFTDEGASGFEKIGAAISILMPLMSTFNAIQALTTTLMQKDSIAKAINTAASWAKIPADSTESAGMLAKAAAYLAAQTAAWPMLVVTLAIVAAVAALVVVITAVVAVIKKLSDAYNADAIAAEKANQTASDLAESLQNAKTSYEEMIAAMEKYQTARDALSELTKGTEEYSLALQEANQAALDLIDNYGQYMNSDDWSWEDGQLVIDDAALENAKKKKEQEVNVAQAASNMGAARAKEAQAKADQTDMGRSYYDGNLGTAIGDSITNSIAASLIPGLGATLAPIAGTLALVQAGVSQAKEVQYGAGIDAIMEEYQKGDKNVLDSKQDIGEALLKHGIVSADLVNALYDNRDALVELGGKYDAAEAQAKAAAQEAARAYIDTNFGNSQYAEDMAYMAGNQYYERSEELYSEISAGLESEAGLKLGAADYFKEMGISGQQGFKMGEITDDGTVKYSVIDENGERQEKEVTADMIASTLSAARAQDELATTCKMLGDSFLTLDKTIYGAKAKLEDLEKNGGSAADIAAEKDKMNTAEAFQKFLSTGNTDSLSKEELDLLSEKSDGEIKDYLESIGINDDTVDNLGYEDINALIESMNLENTQEGWDKALDTSVTGVDLMGMEGASDNLSLAGAENIKAELEEITNFFGEASSQMKEEWEGLTSDIVESLDETSQAEFWDQLGKIEDFESAEDWDKFLEQMKESEELTKEEAEALEDYVDSAKEALKATEELNFEELAKSVKSLEEVMGSISEGNRNISDEQFAALEAEGIDTSKFAKTIDGWRYIGETGDFVKEAGDAIKSKFTEAKTNYDNITDKVIQASNNLTAAQAATASATAAAQANAIKENQGRAMLAAIVQNIKDTIMTKIQAAWEKISAVCVQVYDFFAKIYNTVSQGIADIWNSFATWLEDLINDIITEFATLLEALGLDTSGWEGIAIERMEPDKVQTAAELEEELAAQKLDETVALLDENLGEMCNSIEASADYLSKEELQAGKDKVQAEKAEMEKQYDAIKNDPEKQAQAEAYKKIIDAYDKQLASYDKAMASKQWGEIMGETGDGTGEAVSPEDVKAIEEYADALLASKDNLVDTREEALKVAAAHTRMERGITSLSENWETWNQVMTDGSMKEQVQATAEMKQAMSDILGVDVDQISDDFVKNAEAMDLMKRAAEGDMEALDALGPLFAKEYIADIKINNENFDGNLESLQTDLNTMMEQLQAEDLQIGTSLDQSGYATAMTEMMAAAGTDIETINNILSGLGFEPEVTYKEIPMDEYSEMVQSGTTEWSDSEGNKYTAVLDTTLTADQNGMVKVPVINGSKTSFVGNSSTAATTKVKNPGGKGGNSKKETKKDPMKKDDVVDRYKETEDAIDDVSNAYDRASKAADRMYGAGRIAYMMKANKELLKEIGLLKQKKAQAEEYLKLDKANLEREASSAGITLEFDSNGNIVNYTQELSNLVDEYNKMNEEAWKDKTYSEEETEALEAKEKQIEDLTDAVQQYEETREEIEDIENEIQDKFYEWQDNNYEMWNHSLEVSLKMTGDIKDLIDGLMTLTEDDFFMQAEGLALMYGKLVMTNVEMGSYIGHLGVLSGMMATGAISPDKFIEGLDQVKEGAMNAAQALIELDKQMIEYYGNALEMAREEIDVYTDRMEHCTGVLEHYLSLLDLMGKKKDYKSRGIVLDGRVETLQNELDVIEREAKIMEDEANAKKRLFESTKWYPGAGKVFEQQYRDALAAATETQEEFLAKAEELAQALNDRLENTILESGQRLEDALTGGKGFSLMSSEMEHAVSLQEEWLTTTNKIYETEKLMNKAQQDIDKTTNTVAKRKLKLFIEETNQLKEKSRLSKFELDVQQAKYDLLLAEIALEESQNAKSQVRLQRDAEGNFGYIYTAEADAIAQAEQEYADKQNAFYNMALEGVNNYAEKYYQTLEEMYDTLADIDEQYRNGEFESWDAYQAARLEAENYYFQKLRDYSEIYNIAIQLDTRATKEAWGSEYDDMINKTDEWEVAVRQNALEVTGAFQAWERDMGRIADRTGTSMENLASSVDDVVKESESLKDTLMKENGVLDQIERELDLVSALTAIYAFLRIAVMGAAMAYFMLAAAITAVQMATAIGSGISAIANSDVVSGGVDAAKEAAASVGSNKGTSTGGTNTSNTGNTNNSSGYGLGDTFHVNGGDPVYDDAYGSSKESAIKGGFDATIDKIYEVDGVKWADLKTDDGVIARIKTSDYGFATGGYTGEWGSYGKFAMLHEKELVLNAKDTENFLASMELLDNIVSTIDLHAANQSIGGLVNSPALGSIGGDTLEQTVTIEANFPNVSSRVEIEEAFSTLVNRASQYANRKQ